MLNRNAEIKWEKCFLFIYIDTIYDLIKNYYLNKGFKAYILTKINSALM